MILHMQKNKGTYTWKHNASQQLFFLPGEGQEIQRKPERTMQFAKQEFEPKIGSCEAFLKSSCCSFPLLCHPRKACGTRIHTHNCTLILRLWWWCIRHSSNSESGIYFACALQQRVRGAGARQTLLITVPLFLFCLHWTVEKVYLIKFCKAKM